MSAHIATRRGVGREQENRIHDHKDGHHHGSDAYCHHPARSAFGGFAQGGFSRRGFQETPQRQVFCLRASSSTSDRDTGFPSLSHHFSSHL